MELLVTGASSPLGGAVCRTAHRSGARVIGSVRRSRSGWSSPDCDEVIHLDLEDPASFSAIRGGIDAVIHVAAASEGSSEELMQSCGLGTARLVDRAERVSIGRIVHVSTMAVYGIVTTPDVSARTPIGHSIPYGAAKWAAECYLADRDHVIRSTSVRSPAIAGARTHRHFLARALRAMQRGEPSVRVANPDFMFNNIVHEDTLADFLVHLASSKSTRYQAVPVGSTDAISLREIVEILAGSTGYGGRIEWVSAASQPFSIDSSDALALGYQPLSTRETVERWMRDVTSTR